MSDYRHDPNAYDRKDEYDDWLDEVFRAYPLGTLVFNASRVLFELDPIAYGIGYEEWLEMMDEEVGA